MLGNTAELCGFCTEIKDSLLHLFWKCIYSKQKWFSLVNVFENCGLNMQYINVPHIILGIMKHLDPANTNSQVIYILRYYVYKCRSLGDKPSVHGGLKYLKFALK